MVLLVAQFPSCTLGICLCWLTIDRSIVHRCTYVDMAEKQLFFSDQYKCNKGLGLPELLSGNKNKNMDVTALQNVEKS